MTILEMLIPENFSSPAKWEHSAFYGQKLARDISETLNFVFGG